METKKMSSSGRLLVVMGLGLAGLIAIAAIVVIFREPVSFEPGTPEAAAQEYILAVLDEDSAAAHALLTPDLQQKCSVDDLEERYYRRTGNRVILTESRIDGDTARIEVEFTATYSDDPFDVYESSYNERFDLEKVGDEWRIAEPPWPFYWCSEA